MLVSDLTFSLSLGDDDANGDFDPLTGTLTRQTFFWRLTEATQLAVDAVAPFSICIADERIGGAHLKRASPSRIDSASFWPTRPTIPTNICSRVTTAIVFYC